MFSRQLVWVNSAYFHLCRWQTVTELAKLCASSARAEDSRQGFSCGSHFWPRSLALHDLNVFNDFNGFNHFCELWALVVSIFPHSNIPIILHVHLYCLRRDRWSVFWAFSLYQVINGVSMGLTIMELDSPFALCNRTGGGFLFHCQLTKIPSSK